MEKENIRLDKHRPDKTIEEAKKPTLLKLLLTFFIILVVIFMIPKVMGAIRTRQITDSRTHVEQTVRQIRAEYTTGGYMLPTDSIFVVEFYGKYYIQWISAPDNYYTLAEKEGGGLQWVDSRTYEPIDTDKIEPPFMPAEGLDSYPLDSDPVERAIGSDGYFLSIGTMREGYTLGDFKIPEKLDGKIRSSIHAIYTVYEETQPSEPQDNTQGSGSESVSGS